MEKEQTSQGTRQCHHPVEHDRLTQCLTGMEHAVVTAVEIPTLTQLHTEVETILSGQGLAHITFRVRGNGQDMERFSTELLRLFHQSDWAEPLEPRKEPLEALSNSLLAWAFRQDCFVILDNAHLLVWPDGLAGLLEQLVNRCNEKLHFILLAPCRISFLDQADSLPAVRLTPDAFILNECSAIECLQRIYPNLSGQERELLCHRCGGWVSAMDAACEELVKNNREVVEQPSWEIARYLSAINGLLERWTFSWTAEETACMEKLCVAAELEESLACRLSDVKIEPLKKLAEENFLVRRTNIFPPTYVINGVLQSWLYYRSECKYGRSFLMEQHRIVAQYGTEAADWPLVFFHQLRRGYVEEAALTLRYLSFSEIDPSLSEEYRKLVRKLPPSSLGCLPWVQLGYAISVKYSYPNIAFQYLDQAIEAFRISGDREGVVLGCCQKISLGFFSSEQVATTKELLRILAEEEFWGGELDPLLNGYRKVFTAYALIQKTADYSQAIDLLDQAEQVAIVDENDNLHLWVCFVRILTYKDYQYNDGLRSILDEAMRLVKAPGIQKSLKMCLYQSVAFLYYIEAGQYQDACTCCEQAAKIAVEIGASGYSIYINMIHAYALDYLGRFEQAEQVIRSTEKASCNILNVRNEHLWAYYLIGQSYHFFLQGNGGLALDTAEKAVSYARRSGRISYIIRSLLILSNILVDHDYLDRAESLAIECLSLCHQNKYQFYRISALFLRAQIYCRRKQKAAFEGCFAQLAEESKSAGIYHFNFAKPSTVCETIRYYWPPEKDRNYFAQLEACNTMGTTPEKSENLLPAEVTVQILGPLMITVDGQILEPCASARAAQLLKILALSIEPISIHKVVEAIWQNWEEKSAMNNFYFTLHQLRSYLGRKDAVLYKRGLCSLNDAVVSVDSVLFSRMIRSGRKSLAAGNQPMAEQCFEQGIKLYRGPVLDGDDLPDDALIQRETLEHDVFTAMRDYGIVCIEQNHLDKAEQILSRAVQSSFSDERTYRLLIKTQYLSGNKSSSLATYEKLSLLLHTELGVEPHHLTKSLVDRIRLNLDLSSFTE